MNLHILNNIYLLPSSSKTMFKNTSYANLNFERFRKIVMADDATNKFFTTSVNGSLNSIRFNIPEFMESMAEKISMTSIEKMKINSHQTFGKTSEQLLLLIFNFFLEQNLLDKSGGWETFRNKWMDHKTKVKMSYPFVDQIYVETATQIKLHQISEIFSTKNQRYLHYQTNNNDDEAKGIPLPCIWPFSAVNVKSTKDYRVNANAFGVVNKTLSKVGSKVVADLTENLDFLILVNNATIGIDEHNKIRLFGGNSILYGFRKMSKDQFSLFKTKMDEENFETNLVTPVVENKRKSTLKKILTPVISPETQENLDAMSPDGQEDVEETVSAFAKFYVSSQTKKKRKRKRNRKQMMKPILRKNLYNLMIRIAIDCCIQR